MADWRDTTRIVRIFQNDDDKTLRTRLIIILRVCKRMEQAGASRERLAVELYNRLMRRFHV